MGKMSKLYKTKADDELYYYFLKSGAKRWMYRHKYYDTFGERREKKKSSFKTEKAALKELLDVKAALLNGQTRHIDHNQMTVSQWLDIWYETYSGGWGIASRIQRKAVIDNQMKPLLGKYKLNKLDRTTYIRVYINKLLKTHKAGSVQLFHRLFSIAVNAAVDDEVLLRNRFNRVPIENDDLLENFLTPKELNVFLDVAKKHTNITNYTIILLLSYTGLRRGEALGLKWGNVNFKKKTVTVERTRDVHGERPPKTKNSHRTIPVDDVLLSQLTIYRKWCTTTKFANGERLDKINDYVFISLSGKKCSYNILNYSFKTIYEQLTKDKINIRRITPHGLRHTHASILINNGVPPKTIADRLGNTVEMIYNVYSHSFKELEDKAVSAFKQSLLNGAEIGAN